MKKLNIYRILFYVIGMIVLAFGITLNSKANLGVSPIVSVAYSISEFYPISFPDMTLILYSGFVVIEMIIHAFKHKRKSYYILDLLQLPFSIVFTRFMGLFVAIIPDFGIDLAGTIYGTIPFRLVVLAVAIIATGIGAIMMLDMAIIPNPADGVVQAIASVIKQDIPKTKMGFDCTCALLTVLICVFTGHSIVGINIGTVVAMLCVGRVMGIFNRFALDGMNRLTHFGEEVDLIDEVQEEID